MYVSLDEPEPVDSALTFPSGYDTLEYSWVKATAASVHLQILSWSYKIPTLLRFTMEDVKNTKGEDYKEGPHSNPTGPAEQSERSSYNFWFPKSTKVNVEILESL